MNVVIAAGGTGGHVFPALALADRLTHDHDASVRFIGTPGGQEAKLVPNAGYRFDAIEALPFRRAPSTDAIKAPLVMLRSAHACRPLAREADVVVGMGGYASAPTILAARRAHVPIVLHEPNAVPGLVNRVGARFAAVVAVQFAELRERLRSARRVEVVGYPVRDAILSVPSNRAALRDEAIHTFGFDPDLRTVLVFGGSQGALHLDEVVAKSLRILGERSDLQLLVLTGRAHLHIVGEPASRAEITVHVLPFLDRMELAFAVADLAVTRAGATTIAELTVSGVPAILIPYPHATEHHQEANARALQRAGAADVLRDEALSPEVLAERIVTLVGNRERLRTMGERATMWAKPDAAQRLADLVTEVARG